MEMGGVLSRDGRYISASEISADTSRFFEISVSTDIYFFIADTDTILLTLSKIINKKF